MANVKEIINIGFTLHQEGNLEEAESKYNEVLSLDECNAEVCNLMGVLKLQQANVDSAIEWVEKAIKISPNAYFYETLFQSYIRGGLHHKIIEKSSDILKHCPNNFALLFNIALAHKNLNNNKEAIKYYNKALEVNPASYQAWFNLSHLYSIEAETKNALSAMKVCKKLNPKDRETDYFLSLALMRVKDYDKGLKYFESRLCKETAIALQNKTYPNKLTFNNIWKGENIKDKTILVYYEAGFGDVIMFSRYLPLLAQRCKKILFLCQKQLAPLFRENPNLGIDQIIDSFIPETNIEFDVHAPLLSLPYLLGLKGEKVFAYPEGYIRPNQKLAGEYHKKFFDTEKIKVGIKWQGNTYYDKERVIPTEMFFPLIEVENTQYYSFQTFEGSEALEKLSSKYNIIDIGKDLTNFSQTAAALSNLDLVICNDTSLAHLAGAMGIPCWIILPYEVNWRWHTDLNKCDWYDCVKLFRQKNWGDWSGVFDEILSEMQDNEV